MALGAHASEVRRQVLAEGMKPVLIGLTAGLVAAAWAATLLREALFQVSPFDTATFLLAPALLCASAWLACVIPARRAARVAPMTALRYE
jgi:ABC-type lipoprotein release transport system permease subunit